MKFKNLALLSLVFIFILLSILTLLNYFYWQKVQKNMFAIMSNNELEEIKTSEIAYYLLDLKNNINFYKNFNKKINMHFNEHSIIKTLNYIDELFHEWQDSINGSKEEKTHLQTYKIFLDYKKIILQFISKPDNERVLVENQVYTLHKNLMTEILKINKQAKVKYHNESTHIKELLTSFGYLNFIIFCLAVIIILLTNLLLFNYIIKNLKKFTFSIKKMTEGSLETHIDIKSKNEFGLLADSFNKMSKNLANSRYFIESIMNALPNILIITDLKLTIQQVNDRACVELGRFKEELLGQSLLNILEDKKIQQALTNLTNDEILTKKTFMNIKLNHVPILLSSSIMNFNDSNNKLLINIIQNITSIKKMEDDLISASRQAGMADVAISVLHNVGNILNSLKTSILIIDEINKKKSIINLYNAGLLLREHQDNLIEFLTNNKKGKMLPKFLIAVFEVLDEEMKAISNEILLLRKNIDHIDNIITIQQKMSGGYGIKEQFDIMELIDEAININLTFSRRMIRVIKEYQPIKVITMDKVKLMQVIVNLIKNAIESLIEDTKTEKILKIIVKPNDPHSFIMQVKDNGMGISLENLSKVFSFGFTTKKNGHGFGLHASSLSIKELHGSLKVVSDGIGKGAVFTLILPYF